jgi:hypothetical protein
LFLLIFIISKSILSQGRFPIQASIVVRPPYSVYLSDYLTQRQNKIQVNLSVSDPNQPQLKVKLRFSIFSKSVLIQTKPDFLPTPLLMEGGSIETLDETDLAPYFSYENMEFNGIDKTEFLRTSRLPEGIYTFQIEVIEYQRNTLVSNTSYALAWLILNDPPRWNIPTQNQVIEATNPQNFQMLWFAMHLGSPNAAFNTEYEFKMVEVYPESRNPNDAFNSQVPFYVTTITNTSVLLGASEPSMIPGRLYAARVRAVAVGEERDYFKNNGFSEVVLFRWGNECSVPVIVTATGINYSSARILWENSVGASNYTISYQEKGQASNIWYSTSSQSNQITISNLEQGKIYNYYITADCGRGIISEQSPISVFSIPIRPPSNFECKQVTDAIANANSALKTDLAVSQSFQIMGCEFTITALSNISTGTYNGTATITIGFLQNAKFNVNFTGLKISSDNKIIGGEIRINRN